MRRSRVVMLLIAVVALVLGVGLSRAVSSRAAGEPCVIPILCPTTTTPPPPTTTTTPPPTTTTTPPSTTTTTTPPPTTTPGGRGRYTGTFAGKGRITLVATANGVQVSQLQVKFTGLGTCNDGESYSDDNLIAFTLALREHYGDPPTISKGGIAVFDQTFKAKQMRHGKGVFGHKTLIVTAYFAGSQVTGGVHETFSDGGFHCDSGTVTYTATRAG